MSETKEKKLRVAAVATMLNQTSEDIMAFLAKKNMPVKTVNSAITPEMMTLLEAHYKNALEATKRHQKKVEEMKELMGRKESEVEKEKIKETKGRKKEPAKTKPEATAPSHPPATVEHLVVEKPREIEAAPVTETVIAIPETKKTPLETEMKGAEPIPETKTETHPVIDAPDKKEGPKPAEKPEQKRKSGLYEQRKIGLKVVGVVKGSEADKGGEGTETATVEVTESSETGTEIKKKRKKRQKIKKKPETVTTEDLFSAKKKVKPKRFEVDEKAVDDNIRTTLVGIEEAGGVSTRAKMRKRKKAERLEEVERQEEIKKAESNKIIVTEFISVVEMANLMNVPVSDVISKCIGLGLMVSINQRLDVETITLVADEFGMEVEFAKEYTAEVLEDKVDEADDLKPRSPIVTVMGHVDHGKTSLLDFIRKTDVVTRESGRITQHIGAYKVHLPNGKEITFLDTPGHEAFTAMRARGAQVTDIVVLVVAADDAVMPQTIEAINHAQAASVPIIVAINKVDRAEANPERIRQQLADRNILVEEWGGKYQCVEISAKTGLNMDMLLEKILLEAEVLELKANPNRDARGIVVESRLDKKKGKTATILVQKGTLQIGDPFVAGIFFGRVRAMWNERDEEVEAATPSAPVVVSGFEGAPQAGDLFVVVQSEREARAISQKRQQLKREQDQKQVRHITLDEISRQISRGGVKELPIIVKGDVDGSVEALSDSFMRLSNEEVVVRVIHRGVGAISEGDVLLAEASNAIIIGFHVRPHPNARKLAESQKVDIRIYNIIYEAITEVKNALEGLLAPIVSEEVTATVQIRDLFKVPRVGMVAGCLVQEGKIIRNNKIRLIRDGVVIYEGDLSSLKRFKDDVREVDAGYECGLSISNYNDLKIGDVIEAYKVIETKKKLA